MTGVQTCALPISLLLCGVFCALGGAALALGSIVAFKENMTEGRGYIAFTAVIFGGGGPVGAALASRVDP